VKAKEIFAMTSSLPLVRVICLVYNRLEFSHQLFNTTFSQEHDYYKLIINGGSIDGTNKGIESHVAQLPFTTLKLDRPLTQKITNPKGKAVVQKVLEMVQCLKMRTAIEGTETTEEVEIATPISADIAQGDDFLILMPKSDVQQWIDEGCSER
jgi:predicted signal transduction protein with EAL and GGDEF domain